MRRVSVNLRVIRDRVQTMKQSELDGFIAEQTAIILQADGSARSIAALRLRIAKEEQAERDKWKTS